MNRIAVIFFYSFILFFIPFRIFCAEKLPDAEINANIASLANLISDGHPYTTLSEGKVIFANLFPGLGPGKDAIVLFSIEGFGGGNMVRDYMAIFSRVNYDWKKPPTKKYNLFAYSQVGGKMWRIPDYKTVSTNGPLISFEAKSYSNTDGACCPTVQTKVHYKVGDFLHHTVQEIKGTK